MKNLIFATALIAAFCIGAVQAEDKVPDNEVSFNAAITSDYRSRGISQTRLQPALQGGVDYKNNPTGLYAGTWFSTLKWTKDAGGSGDVEWDLYVSKRGEITKDISYDVGVLSYIYLSSGLGNVSGFADANTTEVYGQIGYGPAYLKYWHSVTNFFGFVESKNSGYLDVGANIDVTNGYTINLHAGHQNVKHNSTANYTDWKVGVTRNFGFVTGAIAVVGTDADKMVYTSAANGKFLGKTAVVVSASKTF